MSLSIEPNRINSIQTSESELDRIRSSYTKSSKSTLPTMLGKLGFWLLIIVIVCTRCSPFIGPSCHP